MAEEFETEFVRSLRDLAMGYPGVSEGDSCVIRAFRAGEKGFLYLGENDDTYRVTVRLGRSLEDATKLSERDPRHYSIGNTGWVTVVMAQGQQPPPGLFASWIDESFRLQAHKKLLAELD